MWAHDIRAHTLVSRGTSETENRRTHDSQGHSSRRVPSRNPNSQRARSRGVNALYPASPQVRQSQPSLGSDLDVHPVYFGCAHHLAVLRGCRSWRPQQLLLGSWPWIYLGRLVHRHQIPLTTHTGHDDRPEQVLFGSFLFPQPVDKSGDSHIDVTCHSPCDVVIYKSTGATKSISSMQWRGGTGSSSGAMVMRISTPHKLQR